MKTSHLTYPMILILLTIFSFAVHFINYINEPLETNKKEIKTKVNKLLVMIGFSCLLILLLSLMKKDEFWELSFVIFLICSGVLIVPAKMLWATFEKWKVLEFIEKINWWKLFKPLLYLVSFLIIISAIKEFIYAIYALMKIILDFIFS